MLTGIVIDAFDVAAMERFWSLAVPDGLGELHLRFTRTDVPKTTKNRVHLDLVGGPDHEAEVARLLALGARRADIGQGDVPWDVLADPEGNEFCVLPQGIPGVLVKQGFAEVCMDSPEQDCAAQFEFWRARSGWEVAETGFGDHRLRRAPDSDIWLVMGPPAAPKAGRNRVRLEVTDPWGAEGEFVDPGGNEFVVRRRGRTSVV